MISNDLYWIRAYFQVITLNHFDPFQIIFCFPNTTINWPSCNQQGTWNVKCHEKKEGSEMWISEKAFPVFNSSFWWCLWNFIQGLQAQSWIFDLLIIGWKIANFYNLRPVFKSLQKHNLHGAISEVIRWPGGCKIKDGPKTLNFNFQVSSKRQILNIIFSWISLEKWLINDFLKMKE